MLSPITINGRKISAEHPPYVIAEMSANHNGQLASALNIIRAAKDCGADAVKLQTYTPDTITLKSEKADFQISEGLWAGKTLYELYKEAHLPFEWHKPLFDYAKHLGITIFSTPFDTTAVDLLESLNAPAYKIASFEAVDIPLIRYVAKTGKPLIISTGMASLEEIREAVDAARSAGCNELVLLKCVSAYPAPSADYNLSSLRKLSEEFNAIVGLSDHTISNTTAIAAVALGAAVIEKHFTLDRNGGGPDDSFSIEPEELSALCIDSKEAQKALGNQELVTQASESGNLQFRRSLYYTKDLKPGDLITENSIKSVRPGFGLPPKHFDTLIGSVVTKSVSKHCPVRWNEFYSAPSEISGPEA